MASEPATAQVKVISGWATDLACPACLRPLQFEETCVVCLGCGRIYPIIDGIPVLIAERASLPEGSREDAV
jgi:uncharacterized protein YbaR (Trm112 family)